MIPKVVRTRDGKQLGYSEFDRLFGYISKHASQTKLRHLHSPETAAAEMKAIAGLNSYRPAYHLILSWSTLEKPAALQMFEAAEMALESLALLDNQAVLAIHRNRPHWHIHTLVNMVDFFGRVANLGHDFVRLEKACREIEFRQGWAQDRGKYSPVLMQDGSISLHFLSQALIRRRRISDSQYWLNRRHNRGPLSTVLSDEEFHEHLCACFDMSQTWKALGELLSHYGLAYLATENGARLVNKADPGDYCFASHLEREWSCSQLEKRFGEFRHCSHLDITSDVRDVAKQLAAATSELEQSNSVHDHTSARQAWSSSSPVTEERLAAHNLSLDITDVFSPDQVREDGSGNLLVALGNPSGSIVGFEVISCDECSCLAPGGVQALAIFGKSQARKAASRIVVVSSALSALRLAQQEWRDDTLYVSTAGSPNTKTQAAVTVLAEQHPGAHIQFIDAWEDASSSPPQP